MTLPRARVGVAPAATIYQPDQLAIAPLVQLIVAQGAASPAAVKSAYPAATVLAYGFPDLAPYQSPDGLPEDWFLHDATGARITKCLGGTEEGGEGLVYLMDPRSTEWRARVLATIPPGGDGAFWDIAIATPGRVVSYGFSAVPVGISDVEWQEGLRALYRDRVSLINGFDAGSPFFPAAAGGMIEGWGTGQTGIRTTGAAMAALMRAVDSALAAGAGALLMGRGPVTDVGLRTYALGLYLLFAGAATWFAWLGPDDRGYYTAPGYFAEWDAACDIGAPTAPRERLAPGVDGWSRCFSAGYVVVHTGAVGAARLTWQLPSGTWRRISISGGLDPRLSQEPGGGSCGAGPSVRGTITLGPGTAALLLKTGT